MKTPARPRHRTKPGETAIRHHPLYQIWNGMLGRCLNPREQHYHRYGGAGITVCERWMDFSAFVEDMGERPSTRHSIDRMDNAKGYEPGNCRWATRREQTLNRSITRMIEFDGRIQCMTDWATELGITATSLAQRLHKAKSIEEAMTAIRRPPKKLIEFNGKTQMIADWAKEIGITPGSMSTRIKRWGVERALTACKDSRFV